ncbi:MAG: isochorismatase family protein, partial [bacterium]|nr:isochorismatase family protein [bacterium]
YAGDREVFGRSSGSSASSDSWPPAEFQQKSGAYEKWARPQDSSDPVFDAILKDRKIISEVEPQPGDDVIVTGDQLHRLLSHRKILHLFYTGFAANMCVPFRDYGMRAMKDRGYDITLIRDCTTAIEIADTAEGLDLTRAAVIDTELNIGYSVSSEAVIQACQNAQ